MDKMIKLSVITVNYRAWIPLERCLNSLSKLKPESFTLEVIIVDNYSNDGELDRFIEKYPDYTFISSEGNYGFSYGNNLGASHASGEILLFLNSDTIVTLEPIETMLNLARQNPQYGIVSSQQMDLNGKAENPYGIFPSFWTINSIIKSVYGLFSGKKSKSNCNEVKVIFPEWVSGSLIMISRETFDQVNGWDEDYWLYSEDADLCKKVTDSGKIVALQCHPSITHEHGGTTRRTMRLTAFYKAMVIISLHIYFRKHYSGVHHIFLQGFLLLNTLILENLIPAVLGLILFPVGNARKYFLIYLKMLKYYSISMISGSWLIDIKKVKLPE